MKYLIFVSVLFFAVIAKAQIDHLGELLDVSATVPTTGQQLGWNGTRWAPANPLGSNTGTVGRNVQWSADATLGDGSWLNSGGITESTQVTAVGIPRGTTAEAPLATTAGRLRWNTTTARPTISDGATHVRVPLMYSATATLDFPSTSANATSDLTIALTGASVGEQVIIGTPNSAVTAGGTFSAWVSAADTVTVRFRAGTAGAEDPATGAFTVSILR